MKIANIDRENLNDLRKFNEGFRKDVIKKDRVSHKQNLFKPSCRSQMEAFKIAKHGLSQVYN